MWYTYDTVDYTVIIEIIFDLNEKYTYVFRNRYI